MPNEIRIGQNSDHRDIARFLSLQDRNFRPVLQRLEHFRRSIEDRASLREGDEQRSRTMNSQGALDTSAFVMSVTNGLLAGRYPFEVPFGPVDTFQGRTDALRELEVYFNGQISPQSGQRIFAICGLGKTLRLTQLYRAFDPYSIRPVNVIY